MLRYPMKFGRLITHRAARNCSDCETGMGGTPARVRDVFECVAAAIVDTSKELRDSIKVHAESRGQIIAFSSNGSMVLRSHGKRLEQTPALLSQLCSGTRSWRRRRPANSSEAPAADPDGDLEIDNNAAEPVLCAVTVCRRNYLSAGSDCGGGRPSGLA